MRSKRLYYAVIFLIKYAKQLGIAIVLQNQTPTAILPVQVYVNR